MKPKRKDKKGTCDLVSLRDRLVAGDDMAYEEIYRHFAKDIYSFGISLRAKPDIIEDAIHDIFVEMYSRREKLTGISNLKLYLLIAFKNRLFYLMKKEVISVEVSDRYAQFYTDIDFVDTWIEAESTSEREAMVKRLMSGLNVHQREVVYHRFVEGLSLDDIALLMNIKNQSVKNLLQRSIKKMQKSDTGGVINILILLAVLFL
jgi:RNA polymerase sigma factor (sigma-70 family)